MRSFCGFLLFAACWALAGCSGAPPGKYEYSKWYDQRWLYGEPPPQFQADQVERGTPHWFLDRPGHYFFSAPGKLLLWDRRVGNHRISEENEAALTQYLRANDMAGVKVRLNEYSPGSEFVRLWNRSGVNPLYRGTVGLLYWLKYTILPDRVFAGFFFCGDHYNPYTDTINLYSDNQPLILETAAHAKNVVNRRYKGTYALAGLIPGVDLYQEHIAIKDVSAYYYAWQDKSAELKSYRTLDPLFPTRFAQPLCVAIGPIPAVIQVVLSYPAALVGQGVASHRVEARSDNVDIPMNSEAVAER